METMTPQEKADELIFNLGIDHAWYTAQEVYNHVIDYKELNSNDVHEWQEVIDIITSKMPD